MSVTIIKHFEFQASHFLPGYKGPCQRMHGHTYKLEVGISCPDGQMVAGMVMDFGALKKLVEEQVVTLLDHQTLNEIEIQNSGTTYPFPKDMPTAENMLVWMSLTLQMHLDKLAWEIQGRRDISLSLLRLWETSNSFAEWRP